MSAPTPPDPDAPERRQAQNLFLLEREREELASKVSALEAQVRRLQATMVWSARVLGPVVLGLLFLFTLYLLYPRRYLGLYGYVFAYPWPQINKGLIPFMVGGGYSPLEITVILGVTDLLVALWFVLNFPVLYRLPRWGRKLEAAEHTMHRELRTRRWLRAFSVIGVFLWVIIPFPGTGTITGAILGRFLGLGAWRNLLVVVTGAVLAIYAYAAGASALFGAFGRSAWHGAAAVAILAVLLGLAYMVYRIWWKPLRSGGGRRDA